MILQKFDSEILQNVINDLELEGYDISSFMEFDDWVRIRVNNKIMTLEKEDGDLKIWDLIEREYKVVNDEDTLKSIIMSNYQIIEDMYILENNIDVVAEILANNFIYDTLYKTNKSLKIVKDSVTYIIDVMNKKVESIECYKISFEDLDNIINGNVDLLNEIKNNIIEIENLIRGV